MITVIQSKRTFEDNLGAPEIKTKRQKQDLNNGRIIIRNLMKNIQYAWEIKKPTRHTYISRT